MRWGLRGRRRWFVAVVGALAAGVAGPAAAQVIGDPFGLVVVGTDGEDVGGYPAPVVAVSNGGNASGTVAVSNGGNADGENVGVSNGGSADGWAHGASIGGTGSGHTGSSIGGDACGWVVVKVGPGGTCGYGNVFGSGPLGPFVGVTSNGEVGPGLSAGAFALYQGASTSGTSDQDLCGTGAPLPSATVAVSGTGSACGNTVAASGTGNANANGGVLAVSGTGDASGGIVNVDQELLP